MASKTVCCSQGSSYRRLSCGSLPVTTHCAVLQSELVNTKAYTCMRLSMEQKHALAAMWVQYKGSVKSMNATLAVLCSQLSSLPSFTDLSSTLDLDKWRVPKSSASPFTAHDGVYEPTTHSNAGSMQLSKHLRLDLSHKCAYQTRYLSCCPTRPYHLPRSSTLNQTPGDIAHGCTDIPCTTSWCNRTPIASSRKDCCSANVCTDRPNGEGTIHTVWNRQCKPDTARQWADLLLGASASTTHAAADTLAGLVELQARRNLVLITFLSDGSALTNARQRASFLLCAMPFLPDFCKMAELASTEITCDRVFGRLTPAITYGH